MRSSATIALAALGLVGPSTAAYTVKDSYSPGDFFGGDKWSFFTDSDPTHGTVKYVDQSRADSQGYISDKTGKAVYIGVDHASTLSSGQNRESVRITSNAKYNQGLFILDLQHMPIQCGAWPAFWTVGNNWPYNGEIDIIEGVNNQQKNAMTLHTSDGCKLTKNGKFTGTVNNYNCFVNATGQDANAGCGISAQNTNSYGTDFNKNNGGIYATEWTSDHIAVWLFPRGSIPSDITSGNPDPSNWPKADAYWQGGDDCNIDSHFKNQQIVFDITFCGDWAGNVFNSMCSSQANGQTCEEYVRNNPDAMADVFWIINDLKVYTQGSSSAQSLATAEVQDNPAGPVPQRVRDSPYGVKAELSPQSEL